MNRVVIAIGGPTAAGKSSLALELAARFGGEIVSADSVQVYRRLDVGSAKPTGPERARIAHHLLDLIEPEDRYSAARFVADADAAIEAIWARGRVPFVVGGTGLYMRSLLRGLFEVTVPDDVRSAVRDRLDRLGPEALHRALAAVDPDTAGRIGVLDGIRICRALEVFEATGKPISEHQNAHGLRDNRYHHLALTVTAPRAELDDRIRIRTGAMVRAGWVDEVRALLAAGTPSDAPGLSTVGYREVVDLLTGRLDSEALNASIFASTRQLSRRQLTWFRGQWTSTWLDSSLPDAKGDAERMVRQWLDSPTEDGTGSRSA